MVCRHSPGDPNCSSSPGNVEARQYAYQAEQRSLTEAKKQIEELVSRTPNPKSYKVLKVEQVGRNLVLMAQYSSCKNCSFDAKKVMVYMATKLESVIFWTTIDPHFSDKKSKNREVAPPPRARFPADDEGWQDALEYAKVKQR